MLENSLLSVCTAIFRLGYMPDYHNYRHVVDGSFTICNLHHRGIAARYDFLNDVKCFFQRNNIENPDYFGWFNIFNISEYIMVTDLPLLPTNHTFSV